MNHKEAFLKTMADTENLALATCVEGMPNVRVVTFAYDEATPGRVYFTTFKGNKKIEEFALNANVALQPLPEAADAPAQVRIFGRVQKSARELSDVGALIARKAPSFSETLSKAGPMLEAYEVRFDKAYVTVGMEDAVAIDL